MNQETFDKIEKLFWEKISIKTNWGYKQLTQIWQESKIEATQNNLSIDDRIKMLEKIACEQELNKYYGMSLVEAMGVYEQLHQLYQLKIHQAIIKIEGKFKNDTK